MKRILVTGAGGPAGINFIKALRLAPKRIHIVGSDVNRWHLELPSIDRAYLLPPASSPRYIKKLNELIRTEKIEFVHCQPDAEVEVVSENREKVKAPTFLPSKTAIRICHDKFKTYEILMENNVPVPETFLIDDQAAISSSLSRLLKSGDVAWLRAARGAGSRASLPVRSESLAREWINYWRNTRSVGSSHFIISEFLPGKDFAFQSVWKDGKLVTSQARVRLEYLFGNLTASGQTSSPSVAMTVHQNSVNKTATQAILSVDEKPNGVFCVDLKENKHGVPCVTEINAGRFFTTSDFYAHLGCNMPWILVRLAYGEKISRMRKYNAVPEEVYWIRIMDGGSILKKEGEFKARRI